MTGDHTRRLDDLRISDAPSFGGKSANLGELLGAGIPVPPGFAVATSALAGHLRDARLEQSVQRALAGVDPDRIDSVQSAAATIGAAIHAAPLADALAEELVGRYRELGARAGDEAPPVAVRSSAIGEDSRDATFAGQQATRLWVRGAEPLHAAVRECWASLYSSSAITYRTRLADGGPAAMGVAVQLMVDAAVSGVMFTCNPVSGDPSMVAINASWGLGSAVVEGEVTPDDFLLSKVTGEVVRKRISSKRVQCVARGDGHGTELIAVPEEQRDVPSLDRAALAELLDLAGRVQGHYDCHQDIEWAIARSAEPHGGVSVVQSRPVTGAAERRPRPAPQRSALSMVMSTFGVAQPKDDEERA